MSGLKCMKWDKSSYTYPSIDYYTLPAPLPDWPEGQGFATGRISLGEVEVAEVNSFEFVWGTHRSHEKSIPVSFFKPLTVPEGFYILGHYCQSNSRRLDGYTLVVKDSESPNNNTDNHSEPPTRSPALAAPTDYTLVWSSDDGMGVHDLAGYFWLPNPPSGYKALGFIVTNKPDKPDVNDVRCVREDLTEKCEPCGMLLATHSRLQKVPFNVWKTRPCHRGKKERGVSVGTFTCSSSVWSDGEEIRISCLKNLDPNLHAMPDLDQIHALIRHYGPTVFFHPKELYMPSSVSWFFTNGALLFKAGESNGVPIDAEGSNLPAGGTNDVEYWLDLPNDNRKEMVIRGNIESAELYVHVKPALGGTFTDIVMWIFAPFNGPGTLKVGFSNIPLGRVGEHVGDWEHFTLRISNFTGKLHSIYLSQHSGGVWVNACDLEFIDGNKAAIYSCKSGHACYPRPGTYLQGSSKLGIGIRNDCARSNFFVDSSTRYKIVSAEYLGDSVVEPPWVHFMREWGPKIVYNSKTELDKIIKRLPFMLRGSVLNFFKKFPTELYAQEGPTGPKEKNNWEGDERW